MREVIRKGKPNHHTDRCHKTLLVLGCSLHQTPSVKALSCGIVILALAMSGYAGTSIRPPLILTATNIYGGNGDQVLAQNECHLIYFTLKNTSNVPVTNLTAKLTTSRTRLMQSESVYPDLQPGASGENITPFQLSTPFNLFAAYDVQASLLLSNDHFTHTIALVLPATDRVSDAGLCLECSEVAGTISYAAQIPILVQFTNTWGCQNPAPCPTFVTNVQNQQDYRYIYSAYTYTNHGPAGCITVHLQGIGCTGVSSWAMRGPLDFSRFCHDYLGGAPATSQTGSRTNYSFQLGSGEVFTIVVYGFVFIDLCTTVNFRLNVLPEHSLCPVVLSATLPSARKYELHWPGYASGYVLETTPQLHPADWAPIPIYPRITNGYFIVEEPPSTNRFFRLRKPAKP
jgi:hypothetical protein